MVTARYFDLLGALPTAGRVFTGDETRDAGRANVVPLDEALWRRADPSVVGRTMQLEGNPTTVVGIVPADSAACRELLTSSFRWRRSDLRCWQDRGRIS
jgi:hypothetical protein